MDLISEGIDFATFLTIPLPMAFPLVAWLDGAQSSDYMQLSILAMCAAFVALALLIPALSALSSFFSGFETRSIQREQDAKWDHGQEWPAIDWDTTRNR